MDNESGALDLQCRKRIYEYIVNNPGVHFRELQRSLGMPVGSLEYHLRYMEKRELVSARNDAGYSRFYSKNKFNPEVKSIIAFMRQPIPRGILLFLLRERKSSHGGILVNFRISAATLSYHLKRMCNTGVLRVEKAGRESFFEICQPDKVEEIVIVYRRSFFNGIVEDFSLSWLMENSKDR
jgi:predicted transcriptional regulator